MLYIICLNYYIEILYLGITCILFIKKNIVVGINNLGHFCYQHITPLYSKNQCLFIDEKV